MPYTPPKGLPTVFDPSFKGVGQKPGLDIWRVEKLAVVKKPPEDKAYKGKLHMGDSYIILQTKKRSDALERHIFFWLGKESSQDEQGVAAYKTVELDTSLGGEPVQHREVMEHESDEFLSLFKSAGGVQYLEGGVATGFKHVDRDAFTTRLLHIKGRRNIRVSQVPVEPSSLNDGDVFILDAGRDIFQWNGSEASRVEKSKGLEMVRQIRDQERGGNAAVHVIENGKSDDTLFWQKFGKPKPGKIKSASEGGDDDKYSREAQQKATLYRVSDASGKLQTEEITEKPYKQDQLDTNDCFIMDTGAAGIFVWVGKNANPNERASAMQIAMDFIQQKKYPMHTPVTKVVESGETPLFKQNFSNWKEKGALLPGQIATKKNTFVKKQFSADALHKRAEREKASFVDDGNGKLEIWRIEDREMAEWPREKYGHLYGGDAYVMLYTYKDENDREGYIIYFWQGLKSTQDERAASAIHTVALDDKYGGAPVQVRVVQNKEPAQFYLIFQKQFGGLVIHEGGRGSGFKNVDEPDSYDTDGVRLFQVRGTTEYNVRAIQVEEKAHSLNSGDVFVLETPKECYLWFGKHCTGDEREFGKKIASKIVPGRSVENVMEGSEPEEFWEPLGGKAPYSDMRSLDEEEFHEPRLFQCSNARGYFYVEEIFDFDQEDLIEDDVMILDTFNEVFVWVGNNANAEEKKKSLETAIEYIKSDPSARTEDDTVLMQIKQGFEPANFRAHFFAWDTEKWSKGKTYEEMVAELEAGGNPGGAADVGGNVDIRAALDEYSKKYDYEFLCKPSEQLPDTIDLTKKEQYLTDEEFEKVFKMTRSEFNALPQWKQSNKKKAVKLF